MSRSIVQRALGVAGAVGLLVGLAGLGGCCSYGEAANRLSINAKAKSQSRETPNCGLDRDAPIQNGAALYNDQLLQCQVEILSTVSGQQKLEYMFEFYDADGFKLQDTSGWNTLILDAGGRKTCQSSSPKPGAEKVVFSMRPTKAFTNQAIH
jgi:hypothetical protein